jgi:hypothetical protein
MNLLLIFRLLIPFAALGLFLLVRFLVKPPKKIWVLALSVGWITGVLNLIADALAKYVHLWHYILPGVVLGLPLDLYIAVSLFYGSALALIYWWIVEKHRKYQWLFLVILPFYGLFRDYFGTKTFSNTFLVWDNSYWWFADFAAWAIGLWITLYVFHKFAFPRNN